MKKQLPIWTLRSSWLVFGIFSSYFKSIVFKHISVNYGLGFYGETTRRWMPVDIIDDASTLAQVQVLARCRQGNKPLPELILT